MSDELFRKKSLNKVKSPEDLNDYVRVANPGIWMVLIAVIVLLVGTCIWGVLGRIETKVPAHLTANGGAIVCTVDNENADKIKKGMVVEVDGKKGIVISADENNITVAISLPDGTYNANIIAESIKPLSFVFN